jgi:LPXTG-motif cell wall-anchored protein
LPGRGGKRLAPRGLQTDSDSATGDTEMKAFTIVAIVLIAAGILVLVFGQFSYTKKSEGARLGPIELTINEKQTVNMPAWAGAGAIVAGATMLVFAHSKHKGLA